MESISNINTDYRNLDGNIDLMVAVYVYDFIEHRLNGYQIPVPENVKEARRNNINKFSNTLRMLGNDFLSQFREQLLEMCYMLELHKENITTIIEGVANGLFDDGIKWASIVAFFVFCSELAVYSKNRKWLHLIEIIAISLSLYISEKILPWINDHGGWDIVFSERVEQ